MAEKRTGPLRRVKRKFVSYSDPTGVIHIAQIDRLDGLRYSEMLECGHNLDLDILVRTGSSMWWGDNAERRRCNICASVNEHKYAEIVVNAIPED